MALLLGPPRRSLGVKPIETIQYFKIRRIVHPSFRDPCVCVTRHASICFWSIYLLRLNFILEIDLRFASKRQLFFLKDIKFVCTCLRKPPNSNEKSALLLALLNRAKASIALRNFTGCTPNPVFGVIDLKRTPSNPIPVFPPASTKFHRISNPTERFISTRSPQQPTN